MSVKLNLDIPEGKEELWEEVIVYKTRRKLDTINDAVVELLEFALKKTNRNGDKK